MYWLINTDVLLFCDIKKTEIHPSNAMSTKTIHQWQNQHNTFHWVSTKWPKDQKSKQCQILVMMFVLLFLAEKAFFFLFFFQKKNLNQRTVVSWQVKRNKKKKKIHKRIENGNYCILFFSFIYCYNSHFIYRFQLY